MKNGNCKSLITQPQMISAYRGSRPAPKDGCKRKTGIQSRCYYDRSWTGYVSAHLKSLVLLTNGISFRPELDTEVKEIPGVFTGGDCATGPSTVIRAIAAGKVAAHNIDEYLGYHHTLNCGVEAPEARENNRVPTGRVNIGERPAYERKHDFEHVECPMTHEEAMQESGRCLRCDVFGCGKLQDAIDK